MKTAELREVETQKLIGWVSYYNYGISTGYIARNLDIKRETYIELLTEYNAIHINNNVRYHLNTEEDIGLSNFLLAELEDRSGIYYFKTREEADNFARSDAINGILIMKKLMGK